MIIIMNLNEKSCLLLSFLLILFFLFNCRMVKLLIFLNFYFIFAFTIINHNSFQTVFPRLITTFMIFIIFIFFIFFILGLVHLRTCFLLLFIFIPFYKKFVFNVINLNFFFQFLFVIKRIAI